MLRGGQGQLDGWPPSRAVRPDQSARDSAVPRIRTAQARADPPLPMARPCHERPPRRGRRSRWRAPSSGVTRSESRAGRRRRRARAVPRTTLFSPGFSPARKSRGLACQRSMRQGAGTPHVQRQLVGAPAGREVRRKRSRAASSTQARVERMTRSTSPRFFAIRAPAPRHDRGGRPAPSPATCFPAARAASISRALSPVARDDHSLDLGAAAPSHVDL